jgi:hypothetical protein
MADTGSFPLTGDGGPDNSGGTIDNDAGAAGPSTGGMVLSQSALIAIIVVVVVVALFGSKSPRHNPTNSSPCPPPWLTTTPPTVASSVLFFVAKKREWTVKETLRRSARKVVTALTPRRSEFPKSVKESGGRSRLDDVPPTPRIRPEYLDLEKGLDKPKKKRANFGRK